MTGFRKMPSWVMDNRNSCFIGRKKYLVMSEGFRYLSNQNAFIVWKCRQYRDSNHFTWLGRRKINTSHIPP